MSLSGRRLSLNFDDNFEHLGTEILASLLIASAVLYKSNHKIIKSGTHPIEVM